MEIGRRHERGLQGRARRGLAIAASLALGIAMFGTVGLSGTLAQDDGVTVGAADADTMVENIISEIFAEIFGGDDATVSGGGNLNMGGSTGSTVTMGGGGGNVNMGGGSSGGGVMMGGDYGG
jgi:hypothetical protein